MATRGTAVSVGPDEARVSYSVPTSRDGWELPDETMPESMLHDEVVGLLKSVLEAWCARRAMDAKVVRNLAIRWDRARPAVGVDPDVAVLSPPPPDDGVGRSVRTWIEGHVAPILAIEVVSDTNPHKDYQVAPDKYAASGTGELWVFDPQLCGPPSHGGPYRLQIWCRQPDGGLARIYAGDGPARSPTLDAFAVVTRTGARLRVADDPDGAALWPTAEEAARARIAELERELASRR